MPEIWLLVEVFIYPEGWLQVFEKKCRVLMKMFLNCFQFQSYTNYNYVPSLKLM